MAWLALVGTLSGAILGAVTTLLADTIRAKRERRQRLDEARRQTYTDYLVALTETDAALQLLALSEETPVDRAAATAAFRSKAILSLRYQVGLVASPEVADAAETTYGKLRDIREALVTKTLDVGTRNSATAGSDGWQAVHTPYTDAVVNLRGAMQKEIRAS